MNVRGWEPENGKLILLMFTWGKHNPLLFLDTRPYFIMSSINIGLQREKKKISSALIWKHIWQMQKQVRASVIYNGIL